MKFCCYVFLESTSYRVTPNTIILLLTSLFYIVLARRHRRRLDAQNDRNKRNVSYRLQSTQSIAVVVPRTYNGIIVIIMILNYIRRIDVLRFVQF